MDEQLDEVAGEVDADTIEEPLPPAKEAAVSPASFWNSGGGVDALSDPTPFGNENALQKLGKPPFEKSARSKFRLLGFLATVYEHVSSDVASNSAIEPAG